MSVMGEPDRPWSSLDAEIEGPATLRDGTLVWIRPVQITDRALLVEFFRHVSFRSMESRYVVPISIDSAVDEILASRGTDDRLSLVALERSDERSGIVAHAEFAADRSDPVTAEVAFLVRDDYQGRGLGTILLHRLAAIARARGMRRFYAYVLPVNDLMLKVFRNSGFPIMESTLADTTRVDIPIVEPPSPFPEGEHPHLSDGVTGH